MSGAFKKIGMAVVTFLSVDKIKDFGLSCLDAAANVEALESQFSQVFGKMEGKAGKALKRIADDTGINVNRMKGSFVKIGAFAKASGMNTEGAFKLSKRAMRAAADSAAFYDRSLEETTESLQSFLKGNYENDAALGLSATETTRNAVANKLYGKSFKDLSEKQKQLALLKMVEDANKASGALGQAARESDTWGNQVGNLKQKWKDFQAVLGKKVLPKAVEAVKKLTSGIQKLQDKLPAIKDAFNKWLPLIGSVTAGFVALKTALGIQALIAGVKNGILALNLAFAANPIVFVIGAITGLVAAIVLLWKKNEGFRKAVTSTWKELKEAASLIFNGIKKVITTVWNAIKKTITTVVGAIHKTVVSKFNQIKSVVTNIWNGIKTVTSRVWTNIKNGIKNYIDLIKAIFTGDFGKAKDIIVRILGNIKDKFKSIFDAARDIVKGAIDKIKGFFNFKWELPKIKLPHFSISGKFSMNPPSIPKFSVKWYKEAMDKVHMYTKPTIYDINPVTGRAKGAGDAGAEMVVGRDTMLGMIGDAMGIQNLPVVKKLNDLLDVLTQILSLMTGLDLKVVLDSGTLVGQLTPAMDKRLGEIYRRR